MGSVSTHPAISLSFHRLAGERAMTQAGPGHVTRAPPGVDAAADRIAQRIGEWQTRLLQLNRRNDLIYFKPLNAAERRRGSRRHRGRARLAGRALADSRTGHADPRAIRSVGLPRDLGVTALGSDV